MQITSDTGPKISARLAERWGSSVISDGFQMVPHQFLKSQGLLGLTDSEMMVLLNVLDYWWATDRLPFPSTRTLARRMGCTERKVQRHLAALVKKRYLSRSQRAGSFAKEYDLSALIARLTSIVKGQTIASAEQ